MKECTTCGYLDFEQRYGGFCGSRAACFNKNRWVPVGCLRIIDEEVL